MIQFFFLGGGGDNEKMKIYRNLSQRRRLFCVVLVLVHLVDNYLRIKGHLH